MKNKEMLWKNNGVKIHPKIKIVGQVYINDYGELEAALGQRFRPNRSGAVKRLYF